jgi:hypothetical protein
MGGDSGGGRTESVSTLSKEQQDVSKQLGGIISAGLEGGPLALPSELAQIIEMPELFGEAFEWLGGVFDTVTEPLKDIISGVPAYEYDPQLVEEMFMEQVADPSVEMLMRTAVPAIEEQWAGNFYTAGHRKAVTEGLTNLSTDLSRQLFSNQMLGQQMGFQSAEAAAGRQLPGMAGIGELFSQLVNASFIQQGAEKDVLAQKRGIWEFQQPWQSPWLQRAQSFVQTPQMETVGFQGQADPWSDPSTYATMAMLFM